MIAHVAEASERSGRVVLWLDPEAVCRPENLDAPVRLAAAYGAEIETVFVAPEAAAVADAGVPTRRVEALLNGDATADGNQRIELLQRCLRGAVENAGRAHGVNVRHAEGTGDAIDHIAGMCIARGPWNIVALTRLPAFDGHATINTMFANVSGATGFLLCGGSSARNSARVAVLAEDAERLPSMLRAAERMTGERGAIHLFIAAETAAMHADLEAHARLLAAESYNVIFEKSAPTLGVGATLAEPVARLKPSLVIAPFGGAAIADGRELARMSAVTNAPILIVR